MRMTSAGKSFGLYDEAARKRPANLSINSDLLAKARALGVNLSGALEEALVDRLARQRRRDWIESNRTAIRSYNQRVEAEGVFGDRMRRF